MRSARKSKTVALLLHEATERLLASRDALGAHEFVVEADGLRLTVELRVERSVSRDERGALHAQVIAVIEREPWRIQGGRCHVSTTKKNPWGHRSRSCLKNINGALAYCGSDGKMNFCYECAVHCKKSMADPTLAHNFVAHIPLTREIVKRLVALEVAYYETQRLLRLARPIGDTP